LFWIFFVILSSIGILHKQIKNSRLLILVSTLVLKFQLRLKIPLTSCKSKMQEKRWNGMEILLEKSMRKRSKTGNIKRINPLKKEKIFFLNCSFKPNQVLKLATKNSNYAEVLLTGASEFQKMLISSRFIRPTKPLFNNPRISFT
jgi:hypothetical protein